MFYRHMYLFYGKEGGITIFCACIKAGAGFVESKKTSKCLGIQGNVVSSRAYYKQLNHL